MPRAYSNDLRARVAAAAAERPCREVASLFGVSVASVVKQSQRLRATGSAAAKLQGSLPGRSRLLPYRDWLLDRIKVPGMTVRALAVELRERGVVINHVTIWHFLKGAGLGLKKKHCSQASRIGPPSREGVSNGASIRTGLIRAVWSSSTRLGRKPIWPRFEAGDHAARS